MIGTALIKRSCGHWKGGYFSAYDQFLSYGGAGAVIKIRLNTTKHRDEGSRKFKSCSLQQAVWRLRMTP